MTSPLLGPKEKGELEALILAQLEGHYAAHGATSLLEPGLLIAVSASGPEIVPRARDGGGYLAHVEIRHLFTALCYLAGDSGPMAMPRDALPSLATEATSATAAQINKLA
jgi:hypothetical protein